MTLNLTNLRFGRLTAIEAVPATQNRRSWLCKCDCGQEIVAKTAYLQNNTIRSCGCLRKDIVKERSTTHGHSVDNELTPTYRSWLAMRQRCLDDKQERWLDYGGRGIKICERWDKFANFLADMGERPERKTIDRIDVNGNYEPSNCRWLTNVEQCNNKRK